MHSNAPNERSGESAETTDAQFAADAAAGDGQAWEEVDAGRYMPRRIKGSYKGRALG
jgi:hypothetical protein